MAPARMPRRVDFPLPLGPMRPMRSPSSMRKPISLKRAVAPKRLLSSRPVTSVANRLSLALGPLLPVYRAGCWRGRAEKISPLQAVNGMLTAWW